MWVKLFLFTVGLFITLDETDISYLHPNSPDNPQDHPYGPDFPPGPGPSQDHPTPSPPHPVPVTDDTPSQNEPTPTPPHPVPVTDDTPSPNPPTPSNPLTPNDAEEIEDPNALKVHLMVTPHTDAGWIYTFEEYYQGKTGNDGGCVKCILDNVMESFKNNPNRKFDMSEMAYFNRWWADQNATSKAAFKEAIKDKQFGFMNGAWVANDEATAYYDDIMENFILGHRWLKDNLGIDANVGWQVDSFGNSASHAGLMAQAGYDAMFFSRADYIDREKRIHEKSLQFNWAPPNPYNESVFTQMLPLEYADARFIVPSGSPCRSIFCGGGLNQDGYNKIERFLKDHATYYSTKNVLFLVCDDFLFTHGSEVYFQGAEAMIKYFNDHPEKGIKVKFSHLSDYVAAVKKDVLAENLASKIPYKHDDTFPYIEQRGHVWTGYFTSKPMYKMLVRQFSGYYNAAKLFLTKLLILNNKNILDATSDQEKVNKALNSLEQTLSIIQHHDSVTGTMKNYVKEDYEKMIAKARSDAEAVIQPVMVKYLNEKISETVTPANVNYDWRYQDGAYDNIFHAGQTPTFSVFNPGHARKLLITVKVPNTSYTVLDESNEEVISDVICHSNDMTKDCFLYFANSFGPYSTKAYKVVPSEGRDKLQSTPCTEDENVIVDMTNFTLKVAHNLLDFDYKYCVTQDNCTKDSFKLDYYYYPSSAGWGGKPPSGAYIFNPNSQQKMAYSQVLSGRVYKGKVVTLLQIFRNNSRTDIKIVHHQLEKGLEVNSYLDPVKDVGTEIVMGVKSNSIDNGNTVFYTDSNGYFMEKRVKDHKDDYSISVQEGLAINYYPMTSNMYIQDESSTQRLSLVTDRAQGASSLNPGELEVMLHRVTRADDWKGVGEILQEKDANGHLISVVTRHYISYSQPSVGIKDQRRQQQYDFDRAPFLWFFVSSSNKFKSTQNFEGDGLVLENLVKFFVRSYQPNEYIVRLNNLDDVDPKKVEIYDPTTKECTILSKFAGITGYQVDSVTELSWMTTKDKSQVSRNVLDPNSIDPMTEHDKDYSTIYLVPMEIRTFSIKVKTA